MERTEEEPTLISKTRGRRPCKCKKPAQSEVYVPPHLKAKDDPPPGTTLHKKEVFSDGWTKWVCTKCGQVKFSKGLTFLEETNNSVDNLVMEDKSCPGKTLG